VVRDDGDDHGREEDLRAVGRELVGGAEAGLQVVDKVAQDYVFCVFCVF
jgi:hypothetical protein